MVGEARLGNAARYLWTLPMFHCHGWAFIWAVTAVGARHVCLPRPDPQAAWELIAAEQISHLCGAPTVLIGLLGHELAHKHPIDVFTGGAAPTPAMLERCETLGWHVTHLYGLTETYGPQVICGGTRSGTSCPQLGARRSRRARASRRWCRSCGWSTRK